MADYCVSDPTAGCDNSQLLVAVTDCCETTNTNLENIYAKLTEMHATQVDCCTEMNANLARMIELLTIISNNI